MLNELSSEPINIVITGAADFERMKAVVCVYDPRDPKGTMRHHEITEGMTVEVPAGWVVSRPASAAPDVEVRLFGKPIAAREKDYGI